MALECPNCREHVSFFRAFRTPAWGSFACRACGSILSISLRRRLLAVGIWFAILLLTIELLQLYTLGRLFTYGFMGCAMLLVFHVCETIVLLERRAFTCRQCGYDLQGLTDERCPECGAPFDRAERERILARAQQPPPRPKRLWLALLVVLGLTVSALAGLMAYRRATHRSAGPPPAPISPPPPASAPTGT